jgi:hypothetical protein
VVLKVVAVRNKSNTESERGDKVEYWYTLATHDGPHMHEARIPVGRGIKTVYGQFELAGTGPMALDVVELRPLVLNARI